MTFPPLSQPSFSLLSSLFPAHKKNHYRKKSKWSTGVIAKTKKKKPATSASSTCSSMSGKANSESGPEKNGVVEIRVANSCSDPSSSTMSESSDGEQSHLPSTVNGGHRHLNGVLTNRFHHPEPQDPLPNDSVPRVRLNLRHQTQTSKTPPHLKTRMSGFCMSRLGLYVYDLHLQPRQFELRTTNWSSLDCCSFKIKKVQNR